MWQQLQCDYYVELILKLIFEIHSLLSAEGCEPEQCLARKSNLENATNILQELLSTYLMDKLLPIDYLKLYSPLIDLKTFIKTIEGSIMHNNRKALCSELMFRAEMIRAIHNKLLENQQE